MPMLPAPADSSLAGLSRGTLFLPSARVLDAEGKFDLIFHFNGEGPVRRELLASEQALALYTLTFPPDKSYAPQFNGSGLFGRLLDEIAAAVSQRLGKPATLRHVALSAWSAGFEGIRSVLYQKDSQRVDALLLIDGLHGPRGGLAGQLKPFIDFARRAERRETLFVVTHSAIPTYQFTSTTESSHFLIDALGGQPERVQRDDGFGLELVEMFDRGNFHVRGYAGNDKADHCAQLLLLRSLFPVLRRHWTK